MPVQVKPMIAEAFIRLSKQKNIDKITVKDLVEACGISRQTFYYHFQDILEVIEWSLDQAFSHLLEQSLAADDPEAVLRGFLETSEESAELLQKLLHSQKREQVERLLVRHRRHAAGGYRRHRLSRLLAQYLRQASACGCPTKSTLKEGG